VSDTCELSYFMIIKLLVCNSTAVTIDNKDRDRYVRIYRIYQPLVYIKKRDGGFNEG
jgi:hypothetical protein